MVQIVDGLGKTIRGMIESAVFEVVDTGTCITEQLVGSLLNGITNDISSALDEPLEGLKDIIPKSFKVQDFLRSSSDVFKSIGGVLDCNQSDGKCVGQVKKFTLGYGPARTFDLQDAYDNGARWIVLCDTNGGTLPHEVTQIVSEVSKVVPGKNLGIHAHNDTGNAVANSLAAVLSGVRQIQGTINGLGERCGNANLMSLIPTFFLKKDFSSQFEISIKSENIKNLTECSRLLDEILNRKPNQHLPYVGAAAFSHKGGLHVSAVQKDPKTYEHINPEDVGNTRNIVVSDQSGKSNIISRLKSIKINIEESDPKIKKLLDEVKDREFIGYSYDGADASFELLARRIIGEIPRYISILSLIHI